MKPLFNLRDKNLSASCFERTVEKDGKTYNFKSVCIQRAYKKKGEDKYTNEQMNLTPEELLKLSRLCVSAYGEIVNLDLTKVKVTTNTSVSNQDIPNDDIPF